MPECSDSEERRRQSHREYEKAYREWVGLMQELAAGGDKGAIADLEFLKACSGKKRESILIAPTPFEPSHPRRAMEDDDEETNPADDVIDKNTPIDVLEPLDIRESDIAKIAECFTAALIWASQAKSLVEMGWRIHGMLRVFRPALLEGMALEARLDHERKLRQGLGVGERMIEKVGEYYRGVLAWCRRCNSLSQLGQRGFAMIYAMRRDLIGKLNTNAALGGLSNKTRQAFNKTVGDFRDSNHGFRNGVMRDESTRIKCKIAQTSEN